MIVMLVSLLWLAIPALALIGPPFASGVVSFNSLREFSESWRSTPEEDRHRLLTWMLGAPSQRHTMYTLDSCKLRGLNKQEVVTLLGEPDSDLGNEFLYGVGSIEFDLGLIVAKSDILSMKFDEDGVVSAVETVS